MLVERVSPGIVSPEFITAESKISEKLRWWRTSSFKIYLGHAMSSWGDRMWGFAVGLYLVILFPDSLLLTAIYGFSNCLSGITFGPSIGAWIDRTQRITAARVALVIQNLAVVLGAILLALTIHFRPDIKPTWNGKLEYVLYSVIILVAVVTELASVASKIALEKDWIVVLAGGDGKKLATLNATMRTINLTTSILAPIVVGQIVHFGSPVAGAVFIALWNCISGVLEYHLLYQIYKMVPLLGAKSCNNNQIPFVKITSPESDSNSPTSGGVNAKENYKTPEMVNNNSNLGRSTSACLAVNEDGSTPENKNCMFLSPGASFEDISLVTPVSMKKNVSHRHLANDKNLNILSFALSPSSAYNEGSGREPQYHLEQHQHLNKETSNGTSTNLYKAKTKQGRCIVCKGWKSYFSHHVKFAGLGLACLYMTVLGLDSVTIGFIYSQGVNESLIGILTAVGAVFGILGSLSFPILRRKLGKNKTGILGFSLESLFLLFCVGSIFATGSPFKPQAILHRFENVSGSSSSYISQTNRSFKEIWQEEGNVILLMVGIIIARYGLWIADLSVTQIFQEEVEESQRGIINGVQDSLNKFMDLLKFALVILLPSPETFGFLIMTSWIFVFLGTLSFLVFVTKDKARRKRLSAGDDQASFNRTNNNILTEVGSAEIPSNLEMF